MTPVLFSPRSVEKLIPAHFPSLLHWFLRCDPFPIAQDRVRSPSSNCSRSKGSGSKNGGAPERISHSNCQYSCSRRAVGGAGEAFHSDGSLRRFIAYLGFNQPRRLMSLIWIGRTGRGVVSDRGRNRERPVEKIGSEQNNVRFEVTTCLVKKRLLN